MRFVPLLILVAACGDQAPDPAAADLAAGAVDDLAATAPDLASRDGSAPGVDGGAACLATTPPTTLYLDYCMDAASSFCFRDAPPDDFF